MFLDFIHFRKISLPNLVFWLQWRELKFFAQKVMTLGKVKFSIFRPLFEISLVFSKISLPNLRFWLQLAEKIVRSFSAKSAAPKIFTQRVMTFGSFKFLIFRPFFEAFRLFFKTTQSDIKCFCPKPPCIRCYALSFIQKLALAGPLVFLVQFQFSKKTIGRSSWDE